MSFSSEFVSNVIIAFLSNYLKVYIYLIKYI